MATNLAIDDEFLNEALRVGGERTKKDTVNQIKGHPRFQYRLLDLRSRGATPFHNSDRR